MGSWDRVNFLGDEIIGTGNRQATQNIMQKVKKECLPTSLAPDSASAARAKYDAVKATVDKLAQCCGDECCEDKELPGVRFMLPDCNQFANIPYGTYFHASDEFSDYTCHHCKFPIQQIRVYQGNYYENMLPKDLFVHRHQAATATHFFPGPFGKLMYNYAEGPGNQGIPTRWDPLCPVVPRHFPIHTIHYDAAACSGLEPWLSGVLFHRDEYTTGFFAGCGVYDHTPEVVGAEDTLRGILEVRDDWIASLQGAKVPVQQLSISPCEQGLTDKQWEALTAIGGSAFGGCCLDPDDFNQFYQQCSATATWNPDWECCYCERTDEICKNICLPYQITPDGGFVLFGSSEPGTIMLQFHGSSPVSGGTEIVYDDETCKACSGNPCVTSTMCCFVEDKLGGKDYGPDYRHRRLKDTFVISCYQTADGKHHWYPGHRYFYLDTPSAETLLGASAYPVTGYRVSEDLLYELVQGNEPIESHIANSSLYLFSDRPLFMINRSDFQNMCIADYNWPLTACGDPLDGAQAGWGPINEKNFILRCIKGDRATMRNPENLCFTCTVGGTTWIYHHRLWKPQLRGTPYDPLSSLYTTNPHRIFGARYFEGHGGMTRLLESNSNYSIVTSEAYEDTNGDTYQPCCTVKDSLSASIVDRDVGVHIDESAHAFYFGDHIIPKYEWQNLGDNDIFNATDFCVNNYKGLKLNGTVIGKCGTRNPLTQPPISPPSQVTKMIVPVDLEAFTAELTDWATGDTYEPVGCNVKRDFVKGYDRQVVGSGASALYLIYNSGSQKRTTTYGLSRRLYRRKGFARQGVMFWLDGICNPATDEYHSGVPCQDLNPAEFEVNEWPNTARNLTFDDGCVGTDYRCGKGIPTTDERCIEKKFCVDPHVTDYEMALMELHPLYSDGFDCNVSVERIGTQYQSQDYCNNTCINTIEIYDVLQSDGSVFEARIGHLNIEQIPGNGVTHLGDNCRGELGYSFAAGYYIQVNFTVKHVKVKYGSSAGNRCDGSPAYFPISKCEEEVMAYDYLTVGTHIFGGGIDTNLLLSAMNAVPFQGIVDGECICSENFSRYLKWDAQFSMSIKPYVDQLTPDFDSVMNLAPNAPQRVEEALNSGNDKDSRGYLYGVIPPWSSVSDGGTCTGDIPAVYQSPDAVARWYTEAINAGAVTLSDQTLQQFGYTRSQAEYHYDIYSKLQDLKNAASADPHELPSNWGPAGYAALMFRLRKVADKMGSFDPVSGCEMDTGENPPEINWPATTDCLPRYVQCCAWCDPNKTDCEQLDGTPCYAIGCPRDINDGGCPSACSASDSLVAPAPTCTNGNYPCEELSGLDFIVYPCDGDRMPSLPCSSGPAGGGGPTGGGGAGGSMG